MRTNKGIKRVLKILTTVSLIMLISSFLSLQAIAAVSTNWLPTDSGVVLASPNQESRTYITKTSDNYFIIAWADDRNTDWDIYMQKLDGNGLAQWTPGGVAAVTGTGNQPSVDSELKISIIPDNSGGIIIAYVDQNNNESIYVKKIDSTGTVTWTTGPIGANTNNPTLLKDSIGGAYLVWQSLVEIPPSTGQFSTDIFASHLVASDGTQNWNAGQPISVAVSYDDETNPHSVLTTDGIAITYRYNTDADENFGLRTSKVAYTGNIHPSWSPYITVAAESMMGIDKHKTISDGMDGIIATYQYNASDIKAQRISYNSQTESFEPFWGTDGISLDDVTVTGNQSQPQIISDNNGNAIIAWLDTRSGTQEIYAQKVGIDGSTAWALNGINISTEAFPKYFPKLVSNGVSGVIITYIQTDVGLTRSDLKIQLLNSAGEPQWGPGGTNVETESGTFIDLYPEIVSNENGGAAVTWLRQTGLGLPTDIHAQYITDIDTGYCLEPGSSEFCGKLIISSSTLTFTDIPDSFNFGTIQSGATSHNCINGPNAPTPSYTCITDQAAVAGVDDMLKIYDDRSSGGFLVNLSPGANTFTDGTNTIPLTNLYVLTTLPQTPLSGFNNNGITYDATGEIGIAAPAYVNEFTPDLVDISDPLEFTTRSASSQFGNGAIVLMDGTLAESLGRSGYFSLYVNYYLKNDATQLPGNYAIIMTYDLMDSTTI